MCFLAATRPGGFRHRPCMEWRPAALFEMFGKNTGSFAPGFEVALLSGAMGIVLVACGSMIDGDSAALPPAADMVTADGGPDVAERRRRLRPATPTVARLAVDPAPGLGNPMSRRLRRGKSVLSPTTARLIQRA